MDRSKIGVCIRKNRELKELSQVQLADLTGLQVTAIKAYEEGRRQPAAKELERIAEALGMPLIVLLHGGGEAEMLQRNENGTTCKWRNYESF